MMSSSALCMTIVQPLQITDLVIDNI